MTRHNIKIENVTIEQLVVCDCQNREDGDFDPSKIGDGGTKGGK